MKKWLSAVLAIVGVVVVLLPADARAELPARLRAALLARALVYEASISGSKGELPLLVVSPKGGSSKIADAYEDLARGSTLGGRKLVVRRVSGASPGQNVDEPSGRAVIHLDGALGKSAGEWGASFSRKHLVVCDVENSMPSGCVLGVKEKDGKPKLIVDLGSAQARGFKFDARLLRIAEVKP